jgi:hypothetical protein
VRAAVAGATGAAGAAGAADGAGASGVALLFLTAAANALSCSVDAIFFI